MSIEQEASSISKKILYAGTKAVSFKDGTKVFFHFQTRLCDLEKTLIDDSRKFGAGKPFELVLGKKFKLEVWEAIVQKMALNEVAEFTVDKTLVGQYPFVSKVWREADIPPENRKSHCCAMTLQEEGIGHNDLNKLLKEPCDLEFTIELVKVEQPDEYQKDTWQLNDEEQLGRVQELRESGNKMFKEQKYEEASGAYAQAIGILERHLVREKPQSEEWLELNKQKIPLLSNFAQCKLSLGDFYTVIKHCNEILQFEPNNVKALFRRAKAHVGAWNPEEARNDYQKVSELDTTLSTVVKKELDILEDLVKSKNKNDKEKFKSLFNNG